MSLLGHILCIIVKCNACVTRSVQCPVSKYMREKKGKKKKKKKNCVKKREIMKRYLFSS